MLILFSIFLRFYFFWEPSFSSDEAHYVMSAIRVLNGIKGLILGQNTEAAWKNLSLPYLQAAHGPAEFLIIIPVVFLHPREFFVRLVFVLISVFTLIYVYFKLRNSRGKIVSLFFLLFSGTSLYAVLWAQTVMYQTLSICATSFILINIIEFVKTPCRSTLLKLTFSFALGLLVFPDLSLFIFGIIWMIFDKRQKLKIKDLAASTLLLIIVAGSFYIPWILYGFFGNDPGNGFRFLMIYKLSTSPNIIFNLKSFIGNFFGFPGVFVTLPFAVLSIRLFRRIQYIKYVWLTIVISTLVYVFKSYIPYFYFVSLFSSFSLVASEGIGAINSYRFRKIIFCFVLIINLVGLTPLFNKNYNTFISMGRKEDQIRKIGEFINKCGISDDETYVSTVDFGRGEYYFGRQSTIYQDGQENRIKLMVNFEKGGYENVKYIHFVKGELSKILEKKLREKSQKSVQFNNDVLLIYKRC